MARQLVVLVVDDDAGACKAGAAAVQASGHYPIQAVGAGAALRILRGIRIDVVLADAEMPEMDGVELARAIKANEAAKHKPAVFLVVSSDEEVPEELLAEHGIRGLIRGPLGQNALADRLGKVG